MVDNPPFQDQGRSAAVIAALIALAQPDPWTYSYFGGAQPFAPRTLNPSITAVQVGNAAGFGGFSLVMAEANEDWIYAFEGGAQPFAPRRLNPSLIAVPVNDPPYQDEGRSVAAVAQIVATWQPPDPQPYFGTGQSLGPRTLSPGIPGMSVDNAPFQDGGRSGGAAELVALAQPDPWTYSFLGAWQPFQPRTLNPSFLNVILPDPPPFDDRRFAIIAQLVATWQPPDPQPYFGTGQALAYRTVIQGYYPPQVNPDRLLTSRRQRVRLLP